MVDPEAILYPTFGKFMGLGDLWEVVGINADSGSELSSPAINIEVAPVKDAEFNCPICGLQTRKAGFEHDNREWRHVDFLPAKTLVHCRRPRVSCPIHGVQQVEAPFERKHSRFTLLFEALAVYLARDMPCRKVGELLRVDGETISAIVQHWVLKAVEKDDLSKVKSIAIDETSFKKKHKYVTVVIDSDTKRVIDVEAGKDSAAVDKFAVKLVKKGGDNEEIIITTSDMSQAFLSGIKTNFPNAEQIIDKFHVKQIILKGLDEVRKVEQVDSNQKKPLYQGRKLFWIPEHKQTEGQAAKIAMLSKAYPKTGRAYRMVCALDTVYECDNEDDATTSLSSLISWMKRSRLKPMIEVAKTLVNHKTVILAYFKYRLTNAICEGVNSLIQAAKRKARGYKTFRGFAAMIYLITGKLKLDLPSLF